MCESRDSGNDKLHIVSVPACDLYWTCEGQSGVRTTIPQPGSAQYEAWLADREE